MMKKLLTIALIAGSSAALQAYPYCDTCSDDGYYSYGYYPSSSYGYNNYSPYGYSYQGYSTNQNRYDYNSNNGSNMNRYNYNSSRYQDNQGGMNKLNRSYNSDYQGSANNQNSSYLNNYQYQDNQGNLNNQNRSYNDSSNLYQDNQGNLNNQNTSYNYNSNYGSSSMNRYGYGYQDNQQQAGAQQGTYSDSDIKKQIKDNILNRYSDVSVKVDNGNVTLSGSVDSQADKMTLEQFIRQMPGVQNVNNELKIKGQ